MRLDKAFCKGCKVPGLYRSQEVTREFQGVFVFYEPKGEELMVECRCPNCHSMVAMWMTEGVVEYHRGSDGSGGYGGETVGYGPIYNPRRKERIYARGKKLWRWPDEFFPGEDNLEWVVVKEEEESKEE